MNLSQKYLILCIASLAPSLGGCLFSVDNIRVEDCDRGSDGSCVDTPTEDVSEISSKD